MLLLELLDQYVLEKSVSRLTEGQYRCSVSSFSRFLGGPAAVADLAAPKVNGWLAAISTSYAPISLKGKKAGITALWNYAAELRLCDPYHPARIRKVKVPRRPVAIFDDEDVGRLLHAAANMAGKLKSGLPVAPLLVSYVRANFETGLRQNDLKALSRSQVDDTGLVHLTQHKTSNPHSCRVSLETLEIIDSTGAKDREKIWPLKCWKWWFEKLMEAAELRGGRKGLSLLRKSHATDVARREGLDAAARSLGHISGTETARRWYVADLPAPAPPKIRAPKREDKDAG